jgi:hypothetical protein
MCSELEKKHPHIVGKLNLLWGYDILDKYLNSLILSDRINRSGFSRAVMGELMTIQRVHQQLFGVSL